MLQTSVITQFVDESKRVLDAMDRKEARVLARTGGYGRSNRGMRGVIRRRKRKSKPGQAPSARAPGNSGLKDVRYQVNRGQGSVAIGHIRYPSKSVRRSNGVVATTQSAKPVPQLLNEGGAARTTLQAPTGQVTTYAARYSARPFRGAAFQRIYPFFENRLAEERLG